MSGTLTHGLTVEPCDGPAFWAEYHAPLVNCVVVRTCPLEAAAECLELAAVLADIAGKEMQ